MKVKRIIISFIAVAVIIGVVAVVLYNHNRTGKILSLMGIQPQSVTSIEFLTIPTMVNGHVVDSTVITNKDDLQKIFQTVNKPTVQRGKINNLKGGYTSRIVLYNGKKELGMLALGNTNDDYYMCNSRFYKLMKDPLSSEEMSFLNAYFIKNQK